MDTNIFRLGQLSYFTRQKISFVLAENKIYAVTYCVGLSFILGCILSCSDWARLTMFVVVF